MTDLLPTFFRLIQTLWLLTKHGLAYFLVDRRGDAGPERLRRFLEEVGGTYLKFGQVLSLQPDIIPREYCNALFSLLDRVPPFDFAEVEKTFVEDLGQSPSELFDSFESGAHGIGVYRPGSHGLVGGTQGRGQSPPAHGAENLLCRPASHGSRRRDGQAVSYS